MSNNESNALSEAFSTTGYHLELGSYPDLPRPFSYSFRVGSGYEINLVSHVNTFPVHAVSEGNRRLRELLKGTISHGAHLKTFGQTYSLAVLVDLQMASCNDIT